MAGPLKLLCCSDGDDKLDIRHVDHTPLGKPNVVMLSFDTQTDDIVHLDEDSARQLFNWLGVWLHGGNRS